MLQTYELWTLVQGEPAMVAVVINGEWCNWISEMMNFTMGAETSVCVAGEKVDIPEQL